MNMFAPTALNQKNEKVQTWIGRLMGAMTVVLITPVVIVLSMLIVRGSPAISLSSMWRLPNAWASPGALGQKKKHS